MAVTTTKTNKPINPRGNDQSPKGYNRAALYSGKALDFDGVNDSVTTSSNLDISNGSDLSYVSYFKTTETTAGYLFENNAFYVAIRRDDFNDGGTRIGKISSFISSSWLDTDLVVNDDHWHQCAMTLSNGTQKIYIDGQEIASATGKSYNTSGQAAPQIGARDTGFYFDGQIANTRVFNVGLTPAQVADLYNNPEKIVPTGVADSALKLWLPMMEGAGTTAYDGSGNGNHGTISGATWTHGIGAPVSQTAVIDWNKGQNLLTYSGQLQETSEYTRDTITVTANTDEAPNGLTEATTLEDTSSSGYAKIQSDPSTSGGTTYYAGIYVKKATSAVSHYPGFQFDTNSKYVIFDNYNGTYNTVSGGANDYDSIEIQNVDSNWWRILVEVTANASSERFAVWPAISSNGTSISASATGSNVFWGASLSTSKLYTPTIGTAQTSDVLLPQGLTSGRDITGVNLFENVRKQGALNLDGNSWAEVHDNASVDLTDGLTLEAWVYYDGSGGTDVFIAKWGASGNRSYLTYRVNTKFYFAFTANGSTNIGNNASSASLVSGWNHVCVTYDGSDDVYYLNGSQDSTHSVTGSIYNSTQPIEIGRNESGANYINADIAQPRIYDRALTAEEVERNYNAGKNIYK